MIGRHPTACDRASRPHARQVAVTRARQARPARTPIPTRHQGQERPPPALGGPGGEPQQRAVVLDDHPEGMAVGRHPLEVGHLGGREVGHPPPGPAQPPAQVDVLGVHEVRLVEPAHLLEGRPPDQEARPRHPVDDLGAPSGAVQVGLLVGAGEPVVGGEDPEEGVAGRVDQRGEPAGRRVALAVRSADEGPDQRAPGVGRQRPGQIGQRARAGPRGRGCTPGPTGRWWRPPPGWPPPRSRGCGPGPPPRRRGSGRAARRREPSAEPLSTTTTSAGPSDRQPFDAPGQGRARLVVDDHHGHARRSAAAAPSRRAVGPAGPRRRVTGRAG